MKKYFHFFCLFLLSFLVTAKSFSQYIPFVSGTFKWLNSTSAFSIPGLTSDPSGTGSLNGGSSTYPALVFNKTNNKFWIWNPLSSTWIAIEGGVTSGSFIHNQYASRLAEKAKFDSANVRTFRIGSDATGLGTKFSTTADGTSSTETGALYIVPDNYTPTGHIPAIKPYILISSLYSGGSGTGKGMRMNFVDTNGINNWTFNAQYIQNALGGRWEGNFFNPDATASANTWGYGNTGISNKAGTVVYDFLTNGTSTFNDPTIKMPNIPASSGSTHTLVINDATNAIQIGSAGGGGSTTFAGLSDVSLTSLTTNDFLKYNGTNWINRTPTNVRSDLGLVIGTNVQAYDADLTTYAGITPSANVQTLLGSADYSAFKTSLSLNNVENTALSTWAGTTNLNTIANSTVTQARTANYSAYTLWANNTASAAAPADLTYENKGIQTYSGTDTWDGTAPTTSVSKQYQWVQLGKKVEVWIWLTYTNAGVTNTSVDLTWPADLPVPIEPTGRTGTNDILFRGVAGMFANTTTTSNTAKSAYIIKTGTGTYKFNISAASASAKVADLYISYITP